MKFSINKILSFVLLVVVITIIVVLFISLRQSQKIKDTSENVVRTRDVITDLQRILVNILDNETGARGYLLTGDRHFLDPLYDSEKEVKDNLRALQHKLLSDSSQLKYYDSLVFYVNRRVSFSADVVNDTNHEESIRVIKSGLGKRYTDKVREFASGIEENEYMKLESRKKANDTSISKLNYILYAILIIGFLLSILIIQRIRTDVKKQRENETRFMALLDAAPDATVIVNQQGLIVMVNKQVENLFGYSRKELVGKPVEVMIPSELHARHEGHRKGFIKEAKPRPMGASMELRAVKKNNISFPVEISLSPIETDQGMLVSASIRDITVRKELETELKRSNAEMEAFTYSVSHDLRAPLRGIIGFTAILEEDYASHLDDEAKRITSVIKNNTMKMGHLIDDLLAFSRTGKQEMSKTMIDTGKKVKSIIDELNYNTGNVEWILHPLHDSFADRSTIRQVWVNLLSNAVKYSGKKEKPVIEIGSYINNDAVVFYIKDNGVGFDQKYAHKLFQVFQRLHSADEFEGTGVGLALVEKIITKHGGKVWAEAKEGEGASFYFSLPVQ